MVDTIQDDKSKGMDEGTRYFYFYHKVLHKNEVLSMGL